MATVSREELEKEGGAVLRELFRLLQSFEIQAAQAELDVDTGIWGVEVTFKDGYRWRGEFTRLLLAQGPEGWGAELAEVVSRLTQKLKQKRAEAAENVPLLTEYVIGFRQWQIIIEGDNDVPNLAPIGYGTGTWDRGAEVRAVCSQTEKQAREVHSPAEIPSPGCECGLYAYYEHARLSTTIAKDGRVAGMIVARGAMQVYREGFRSEYAKPVLLFWTDAQEGARVREVAAKMGIDSIPREDIERVIPKYGVRMPSQLVPEEGALWIDLDLDD